MIYVLLNNAFHHGPSLSLSVWMHVNSPWPQLELKLVVLTTFHGFILLSLYLVLIVIHSFLGSSGFGTTVFPVDVLIGFIGSGYSSSSSTISSSPVYSHILRPQK